jgi:acyl transferase domain-containing protein/NAD(P)-dependent dehydrogenase (short-subunit alcohol dehydrogenase family)/acyl carrier protein
MNQSKKETGLEIAIIGMTARFQDAKSIDEFWDNLKNGIESIPFFTSEELEEAGVNPELLNDPNYVKAHGDLRGKDYFDHSFFGYSPKEAEVMDPQIRIFHEISWQALELAGYDPTSYHGAIGIYAGSSDNFSWRALEIVKGLGESLGSFGTSILNNSFFLSTRVSHKLNLKGPSLTFFTACSTSLVAVHLACRALLTGECDMALAGGVSVQSNAKRGYMYEEGMIFSPDGHCRTFDAKAQGTIYGEGAGIVVLKRLKAALADGDTIHAVIKGSAINNDGTDKASFTAPSKTRIADVARKALTISRLEPGTITYIEAHGTATPLGDTIEIGALSQAFDTGEKGFCRIGTVKTNLGHLDVAAGIAALIKTVLALKHKMIPASLHFETPNPNIDFENSPFVVNTRLSRWENGGPLRAGVNSAGLGGTNAFMILEEAPQIQPSSRAAEWQILLLSARTESALDKATENLKHYLKTKQDADFPDIAYTLQVGRKPFQYRKMLVCRDIHEALDILSTPGSRKVKSFVSKVENPDIVFMFSGLGSQYVNMGLELYQKEPLFRQELDRCFEILEPLLDFNVKEILYPANPDPGQREEDAGINRTEIAQIVIFIVEYALARLLIQWGIKPRAMTGYSFGEYTAACIAGVFSLETALELIVYRGASIKPLPPGFMLSVPLSREQVDPLLDDPDIPLSIAIDNGPSCIVSGPCDAVGAFEHIGQVTLKKPQIPYISNVTGDWITAEEVIEPQYWANHLSRTVQFAEGIKKLVEKPNSIFIEIGPGRDLSALVQRFIENQPGKHTLNVIPNPGQDIPDTRFLLNKIGQLWLYGKHIDWNAFHTGEKRHRIPIPTYPFERQKFSVEGDPFQIAAGYVPDGLLFSGKSGPADWFYIPSWKRARWPAAVRWNDLEPSTWLLFMDECGLALNLVKELEKKEQDVILVTPGSMFSRSGNREYSINPADENNYKTLFQALREDGDIPGRMIHCWGVTGNRENTLGLDTIDFVLDTGFYCLLNIARAMGQLGIDKDIQINVVTDNMQDVISEKILCPEKATMLGAVKGIPKEYANITLRGIDVILPEAGHPGEETFIRQLLNECAAESIEPIVAFRGNQRWLQIYEPAGMEEPGTGIPRGRDGGVYLVTGGLGGIGYVLAGHLAKHIEHPKLILTGRTQLPHREEWQPWLDTHEEDDPVAIKINKVLELENTGASVLACTAENSDLNRMRQVLELAEEQFGPLDGIIHSAGLSDGAMIQLRTREHSEILFSSKVRGTLVLEELTRHKKLDFFVLCSSNDAIIANAGQVGYSAANAFLNAFAHYKSHKKSAFTTAMNWPRWQSLGMAVIQENLHKDLKGVELTGGLSIPEGLDAFNRILADSMPQVSVSRSNLGFRYEQDKTIGTEALMEEFGSAEDSGNLYQRPELTSEYLSPRNELEETLADTWQNSFAIEQIGVRDDFFELGGDSLKAIIVISKIHKQLDVEVPISEFFSSPTIAGLAEYITHHAERTAFVSIQPAEEKEYYELSSAQKRLYVLQRMDEAGITYNEPLVMWADGNLVLEQLKDTFNRLVKRHDSLRTAFEIIDAEPVQRIHQHVDFEIGYHENQAGIEAQAETVIQKFILPFDLHKAPLLRVELIKFREQKHLLIIDIHHIIADGTSVEILMKEFLELYEGAVPPPLRIQYKDYLEWQKSDEQLKAIKRQEDYWLTEFAGEIPVLHLPTDYSMPRVQSFEGGRIDFDMTEEETIGLETLASKEEVTIFMMLLAIYNILLAKLSGQHDIVVGTGVIGRRHEDLRHVIGMFVNTLPLRNYPRGEKTFREFLLEIKKRTLEAFDNQDYPFENMVDRLKVNREVNRNPLFNVIFQLDNIDNIEIPIVETTDLEFAAQKYEIDVSRFDIRLRAFEVKKSLRFRVEYFTGLFKEETIVRFIRYFKEIASIVVKDGDTRLENIQISHDLYDVKSDFKAMDYSDFNF